MTFDNNPSEETLNKMSDAFEFVYGELEEFSFAEFGTIIYMLTKKWCNEKDKDVLQFADTLKTLLLDGYNQSIIVDLEEKNCINQMNQIHSSKGKLICEIFHDEEAWVVAIKKKDLYSFILLQKDGSFKTINEDDGDPIAHTLHLKLTT